LKQRDLIFGIVTLCLAASYYWATQSVPVSRLADPIGPRGLPHVYAAILAALSAILIVRSVAGITRAHALDGRASDVRPPGRSARAGALGMLLIGVAYLLVAPWLGYLLSIAGIIFATSYYQGGGLTRQSAAIALGGGIFFWLLFVVLMGIAQPPGIFPPYP
jgi:hypothetical protein